MDDSGRIWQDINKAYRGNPPGEVLAHGWLTDEEVLAEMTAQQLLAELLRRRVLIESRGGTFRLHDRVRKGGE